MTELNRRKEAAKLYYDDQLSKAAICRRLNCSRPWLDRWLGRYDPDNVEESLRDRSSAPQQPHTPWSETIRRRVLAMRRRREKEPYQLIGAEAIHHELDALEATEVPPIRTIHSWLVEAELVSPSQEQAPDEESLAIPLPEAEAVNTVQCLDLKGPLYLQGSDQKHYLVALRDGYSRRCAIDALKSRKAQGIVDFLVASWRWLGLPRYLQMDNALEFRGSNRYPRSFGQVVRVALDLQIEPVFIPTAEPWRNGLIEWLNGFLDDRLLAVECADHDALRQEAQTCQQVCNEHHRLSVLDGSTPNEVAAQATLSLLPTTYQGHQRASLPQDHGFVSFVRLVRKSGRITLGAGDRFMVDPDLAYTYVLARVDLAQQQVVISQEDRCIQTYDFSPETVGAWAADEQE
jgi:putative transposase